MDRTSRFAFIVAAASAPAPVEPALAGGIARRRAAVRLVELQASTH
jgi:hypothetical protein